MTPQEMIALILAGIQGVSQVIAWLKGQSGVSDADKAAQVQQLLAANDALYTSLKQQLNMPIGSSTTVTVSTTGPTSTP